MLRLHTFLALAMVAISACVAPGQPATPTPAAAKPTTGQPQPAASPVSSPASAPSPAAVSASLSPATKPVAAAPSPSVAAAPPGRWTFDTDQVGGLPNAAQAFTGQWAVRNEPDAPSPPNALCQTGQAEFPALQLDAGPYTDLTLATRFKAISGREDQAAGLIFRVQDRDNYYILRANALEDNVNFYSSPLAKAPGRIRSCVVRFGASRSLRARCFARRLWWSRRALRRRLDRRRWTGRPSSKPSAGRAR